MALLMKKGFKKSAKINFTKTQRLVFLRLCADLLQNGFSLQQALSFMEKSGAISSKKMQILQQRLATENDFSKCLASMGFGKDAVMQIEFALHHGDLAQTMKRMHQYTHLLAKQRTQLQKVMAYPLVLLSFLGIVLIGIRQILLPSLLMNDSIRKNNFGIQLIQQFPYYCLFVAAFFTCFVVFIQFKLAKKSILDRLAFYRKMPIIGDFYMDYLTGLVAFEWGKFLSQGIEFRQMIHYMKEGKNKSFMKELSEAIEKEFLKGYPISSFLEKQTLFARELTMIIQQGEAIGALGKELLIYGEFCWRRLLERTNRFIYWIQPIVFVFVALLIIGTYMAMLLPIYNGMERFL